VPASSNLNKLRTQIRTRDERLLASQLKRCTDPELVELALNEKIDTLKLLARDPHPEAEKQRSRLIRITAPRDRERLVAAAGPPPRESTAPHAVAWEPASEIVEMSWEAPVGEMSGRHAVPAAGREPPEKRNWGPSLAALVAAIENGPSRPAPGVVNLHSGGGRNLAPTARLSALEKAVEKLSGRPLVVLGTDGDFDETVAALFTDKHGRRLVAAIAIGRTPPAPPLPNQVTALDPIEAGAKLARQGIVDRDGMRSIVDEARASGISLETVRESLERR
jgi:hypothetical protein